MRRFRLRVILPLTITAFLLNSSILPAQQNSSVLYQRGRMLEETGQVAEAIKVYGQVVSQAKEAGNRALAAKAQFRIGVLQRRLGRTAEARSAFKIVVGQYSDQPEVARRALAKLGAIGSNGREKPALIIKRTGPSSDGQFLASLAFPKGYALSAGAFDSRRQRLYLVTQRMDEVKDGQKLTRGQRQVLSIVYWPTRLIVINAKTQSVVKIIPFPVFLGEIAYNPTNDKLYANATIDEHIRVIDPDTFSTTAMIRVPGYPGASIHCVNPQSNKIYIGSQGFAGNDKLFVIDGATNAVSGPFDLGGVAGAAVVNQATNRIYVVVDDRTRIFRGEDNSVLADLPGMHVSAVDSTRNRVYARTTKRGEGSNLLVLDGYTHAILATLHYDDLTESIGLDPNSDRLYVPLPSRNHVAVIDTTTLTEINRVHIAGYPKTVMVDSTMGSVYFHVANDFLLRAMSRERLEPEKISEEFFDEFNELQLAPEWKVLKGLGSYSLNERPGFLRFHTSIPVGASPNLILTRKFHGDHWTLETKVSYFTGTTGGGRDLRFVISFGSPPLKNQGEPNLIMIIRGRDSWNNCCPGTLSVTLADNGPHFKLGSPLTLNASETYYWRVNRVGKTLTVEASNDGVDFTVVGTHVFGPQIEGLVQYFSMSFNSHQNNDAFADYDYVRLKKN